MQTSKTRFFEQLQVSVSAVGNAIKSQVRPIITGLFMFMMLRVMLAVYSVSP